MPDAPVARLRRADEGSATVLAALIVCLLMAASVVAGQYAAILVARTQTAAAADLAALAGAARLGEGDAVACHVADRIAAANGAELVECVSTGDAVRVEVSRHVSIGRGGPVRARAHARLAEEPS